MVWARLLIICCRTYITNIKENDFQWFYVRLYFLLLCLCLVLRPIKSYMSLLNKYLPYYFQYHQYPTPDIWSTILLYCYWSQFIVITLMNLIFLQYLFPIPFLFEKIYKFVTTLFYHDLFYELFSWSIDSKRDFYFDLFSFEFTLIVFVILLDDSLNNKNIDKSYL